MNKRLIAFFHTFIVPFVIKPLTFTCAIGAGMFAGYAAAFLDDTRSAILPVFIGGVFGYAWAWADTWNS